MTLAASDFRLDGQTVAVIGASGGIGAASAVACADAGAEHVALLARSSDQLTSVSQRVAAAGARTTIASCDVTSTAAIDAAFADLEQVDVLVQCAGANQPEPFIDVSEDTFNRLFAVNVRGVFFSAQAAARKMLARGGGGAIILLSSQMGHVGAVNRSVYCATKHALEGMTKALAVELAESGIRVVAIAPTFVRTTMTQAQLDDPVIGPSLLTQIPQRRFGSPEDVALAVVYAASPAARLMTGTSLVLDGGWTAQ